MRYDPLVRRSAWLLALAVAGCDGELRFAADPVPAGPASDAAVEPDTDGSVDAAPPARCAVDADCPFASQHCDPASGACVACVGDHHCASEERPRCDLASHRCVHCGVTADCEPDEVCDPSTRRCRARCGGAAEACPSEEPVCDTAKGVCTCTAATCVEDERAHCDLALGVCVECLADADCHHEEPRCVDGRCVRCRADVDCGAQRCDPVRHLCVD